MLLFSARTDGAGKIMARHCEKWKKIPLHTCAFVLVHYNNIENDRNGRNYNEMDP